MGKLGIDLGIQQNLKLSPKINLQVRQSIELLQLSHQELDTIIQTHLENNPLLEIDPLYYDRHHPTQTHYQNQSIHAHHDVQDFEYKLTHQANFRDDLHQQINCLAYLNAEQKAIAHYLIESLDEVGYLPDLLTDIYQTLQARIKIKPEDLEKAHLALRGLQPTGIGAANAWDCVRLHVQHAMANAGIGQNATTAKYCLAEKLLEDCAQNNHAPNFTQLSKKFGADINDLQNAYAWLRTLPTQAIEAKDIHFDTQNYITPDILIIEENGSHQAILNQHLIPQLHLNIPHIKNLTEENQHYLQEKIQHAKWLIQSLQKRFDTLEKLAKLIVEEQKMFFQHGVIAMRPLHMQAVANHLGVHVSTVSRMVRHKYLQCKKGTFQLRYFFSYAVKAELGEVSSHAAKECIKNLIQKESTPLSDDFIAQQLKQQYGIDIARRTISKYRCAMGMPCANKRKKA